MEKSNLEKEILKAVQTSLIGTLNKLIKDGYNNPLNNLYKTVIKENESVIFDTFNDIIKTTFAEKEFKEALRQQVIKKISASIVSQSQSVIERSVEKLKQNPSFKAKMLLMVEEAIQNEDKS